MAIVLGYHVPVKQEGDHFLMHVAFDLLSA